MCSDAFVLMYSHRFLYVVVVELGVCVMYSWILWIHVC